MRKRSGQIFPFLLIIMAIFLGAYLTTVRIGRGAMNITCTSNAADSCALAAASGWDAALNQGLAVLNHLAYQIYTDMMTDVNALLSSMNNNLASESVVMIKKGAHPSAVDAEDRLQEAIDSLGLFSGSVCTAWDLSTIKQKIEAAKSKIDDAKSQLDSFNASAILMESRIQQGKRAADNLMQSVTRNLMDGTGNPNPDGNYNPQNDIPILPRLLEAYTRTRDNPPIPGGFATNNWTNDSRGAGAAYGFQNSCWFAGLPSGTQQGISNSFDMDGPAGGTVNTDPSYRNNTYSWTDSRGGQHSYGVGIQLPKIASYDLETTKSNHPDPMIVNNPGLGTGVSILGDIYGKDTSSAMSSVFNDISSQLNTAATEAGNIQTDSSNMTASLLECPTGSGSVPANYYKWTNLGTRVSTLKTTLETIKSQIVMADGIVNSTLLPQLEKITQSLARGGSSSSSGYDNTFSQPGFDANNGNMVMGIKKINYQGNKEEISCKVTQTNPDGSTTSSSTANFNSASGRGGNTWTGGYCAKITGSTSGR